MVVPWAITTATGTQPAGWKAGLPIRRPWWLDGASHHRLLKPVLGHFHTRLRWAGVAGGADIAATSPPAPGSVEPRGLIPAMHGTLPSLRFHRDRCRLPAMENAGHVRWGHGREAPGSSCTQGDTCRGVLLAPPAGGPTRGRHAGGSSCWDPVLVPKPVCTLRAAGAVRGPGQAPSPSPPHLELGQSPPWLGWEKPLNQGHLPGDWRLSEPHEPLSCQGRDARHPGSQAPATPGQRRLGS